MQRLTRIAKTSTLAEQAAQRLRELITSGEWPVGTRVPPEHALVDQLGLSRNTVREALRGLVHTGLLEARVGDGTYVIATSELRTAVVRRSSTSSAEEVIELRAVLEEHAAALASRRADEVDVDILRSLLAEATGARTDLARVAELDRKFHREIVRIGGNGLLSDLHEHLGAAISEVLSGFGPDAHVADAQAEAHTRLVDCIGAHDEAGARLATLEIMSIVRHSRSGDHPSAP